MSKKTLISLAFAIVGLAVLSHSTFCQENQSTTIAPNLITDRSLERTSFQQVGNYDPRYDLKTDVVMVYGAGDDVIDAIAGWREKSGSKVAIMTGIAWGGYEEYLDGKFDGVDHWDDAQVRADDSQMLHGPRVPYLSPSVAFTNYLEFRLRKLVDAGIDEIYLEEPEFWAFTGFGESFKREWKIYYDEDWIRPDSTCDAQYRASKLKQALYRRALDRVATGLKEYSLKRYNRSLKIYVATHSLLSYAQIQMVSPEASLLDLPAIDGFIAQIWTGTSRFGNFYNGVFAERTFEMGMLEYGCMQELTRGTGKRVYYLNDPVEDDPKHDWNDYRTNYLCTLVASLMRSGSHYYEVAPWPWRIFLGAYPANDPNPTTIPNDYATTLTLVFNQLRDMDQPDVEWLDAAQINGASDPRSVQTPGATEGIGVLLADSAMYQRANPTSRDSAAQEPSDPLRPTANEINSLNDYLGLTLPLIKRGVPVDSPILDNIIRFPGYLDQYKVLVLSYDFQKPYSSGQHAVLADWVARGGALVFVDSRLDPYNQAKDWWNSSAHAFDTPGDHLLQLLGLKPDQPSGKYQYGKGVVFVERKRPSYFSRSEQAADEYRKLIANALESVGLKMIERNYFLKRRGPYLLAATMTESNSDEPLKLKGQFVNLFDPELKLQTNVEIKTNERAWLLDLNRVTAPAPAALASSCRIEEIIETATEITIKAVSTSEIDAATLMKLRAQPKCVKIDGKPLESFRWDAASDTLFFKFRSSGAATITIEK